MSKKKLFVMFLTICISSAGTNYWLITKGMVSNKLLTIAITVAVGLALTLALALVAVFLWAKKESQAEMNINSFEFIELIKRYHRQKITVTSIFFTEKKKRTQTIILLYDVAIILFIYLKQDSYIIILSIILSLLFINQKLLSYRIKRGYFINNEYEARELIEFILANQKDIDFSDGDNDKRLFEETEKEKQINILPAGVKTR